MNTLRRIFIVSPLLVGFVVARPAFAETADDVVYKVLTDDLAAELQTAKEPMAKLVDIYWKVQACTPDKVKGISFVFYATCAPKKSDASAATKLDACILSERARLQANITYLLNAQSETSWWTRVTSCSGLSDAWTAFKQAVSTFVSSARKFVAETRECLVEAGKLLIVTPSEIADATKKALFSKQQSTLGRIVASLRGLANPTVAIAECKETVAAAKQVLADAKKVVSTGVAAVKETAAVVKKETIKSVCKSAASAATSVLEGVAEGITSSASWVGYAETFKASEIGGILCWAGYQDYGQMASDALTKAGSPSLVLGNLKIRVLKKDSRSLVAAVSVDVALGPGNASTVLTSNDSLRMTFKAEVTFVPSQDCKPEMAISLKVTETVINNIPNAMVGAFVNRYVVPTFVCTKFPLSPLTAQGMSIPINYCKVIDACLSSSCTAPFINAIAAQVFPMKVPATAIPRSYVLVSESPKDAGQRDLDRALMDWSLVLDQVKLKIDAKNPKKPSLTAVASIGPPNDQLKIAAKGTAEIRTECKTNGEGSITIVPRVRFDFGATPASMKTGPLQRYIQAMVASAFGAKGIAPATYTLNSSAFSGGGSSSGSTMDTIKSAVSYLNKVLITKNLVPEFKACPAAAPVDPCAAPTDASKKSAGKKSSSSTARTTPNPSTSSAAKKSTTK
jgi:hypothetical protein